MTVKVPTGTGIATAITVSLQKLEKMSEIPQMAGKDVRNPTDGKTLQKAIMDSFSSAHLYGLWGQIGQGQLDK